LNPDLAVRPIADCAQGARPLAAFIAPDAPEAFALLTAAGVPNFRSPESCADGVAAALNRRAPVPWSAMAQTAPGKPRTLDELAAYALLDRVGVPRAPAVALDANLAAPPALPFPYPVAAKVLAADIAHKSDVGGVALDIADGLALVRAVGELRANVSRHRPGTAVERVLVQPMVAGVGEVLIAYRVEPEVGPLVMLAMGGVLTEIYRDRVLRLAPVDLATAREMIAELKGVAALSGFRGRPAGDLAALAKAIAALSQLASDPTIVEAEVNPLIVRSQGQGVLAVDALVLRADSIFGA
jgi:acyl-CoA synthetase (NDP forming)